ncbi:MAG: YggS family pyridoxal phosphate enzyme [Bacteroidetes bacterium GWF2_38_335]|nr:MAG: YggS family pyridoxal phosphate enzyme [Bacteroidetes bacterium GWF2_38_335]OFY78210.1 MAG: YggS family pyridoxal phosphate enzyme [Bacteroidetes bacterium RIFOXYA12_FULL_38_20]HBS88627.1 YggS family pyridoxal phosphate-dependent enzyme [Bacteroidales bacterium]
MSLKENYYKIKNSLSQQVKLVAVSKTKPDEDILELYNEGQRVFGENKVQELVAKYERLPKDIEWHMIGHLQSNKVKYIAHFVTLIHGVDSMKLLEVINKEALKKNRVIDCLLQFHIAKEESKFGFNSEESKYMLESQEFKSMNNIRICGIMGMATYTDNTEQIRLEFKNLSNYYNQLKNDYFYNQNCFNVLSMGMSDDYHIAVEEGSTMVRIGSSIFGSRNY